MGRFPLGNLVDATEKKRRAALAACDLVQPGMVLGLGTGSTVQFVLEELAHRKVAKIVGVPTSIRTETECQRLGLPLSTLEAHPSLDLTIDGADELDAHLHLIKGGGGALLREKVVAAASREVAIIADDAKLVDALGSTFPVPVEVVPFAVATVAPRLKALGAQPQLRQKEGQVFTTDNGNRILDARFPKISDPPNMERAIKMIPGVAEVGLFVGLAHRAFVAGPDGVRELKAKPPVRPRQTY